MELRASQYVELSDGGIRAAVALDFQYPAMKKARIGLVVADGSSGHWAQALSVFHDDGLDEQPTGGLGFYLSDSVGLADLPTRFCRPSASWRGLKLCSLCNLELISGARRIFDRSPLLARVEPGSAPGM